VLTTHAHQLIAEAGLEAGIDTDHIDDGLFFPEDSTSGLNTDPGLWDDHSDTEDNNISVDSRTAHAVYR
jgi:hypothetical protein